MEERIQSGLPHTARDVVEKWAKTNGIEDETVKKFAEKYLIERQRRKEAERENRVDYLTGLLNRRGGIPKVRELLGFSAEEANQKVASNKEHNEATIFALDANNLKRANDRYGHDVGDAYIKAVADALRKEGIALRMGGDEFLLARKFQGHDDVLETRKRIHENLKENLRKRLEELHEGETDRKMKKNFALALKDFKKNKFSLAIGGISVVKREHMPEKLGLFTAKRMVRAVSRYIPNFMRLKPQEESGLFHHTVSMEGYLDRNRKKTTMEYIGSIMRDADLLGYLHKYTRKKKTSSPFLVKIDAVRRK